MPTTTLFGVQADGEGQALVPFALHDGDKVMITAEPKGGSMRRPQPPVISAEA